MKQSITYRFIALGLSSIFSLFIIGLPVVMCTCPMMKMDGVKSACCAKAPAKELCYSPYKNTSCCKITILAAPNTTEFVPHTYQQEFHTPVDYQLVDFDHRTTREFNEIQLVQYLDTSPPAHNENIPVLLSSLLI